MNNVKTELLSAKSSELPEPQKLFIGIEIEVANYLGYPLLERLIGHKNEYFDEFCRECPDTKFSILGRGSPYELTHEQNLYIRIDAKVCWYYFVINDKCIYMCAFIDEKRI